jgi:hypothetical protein
MKKLEDIPKKKIFNVPDGYFDRLPTQIQSRIASKQQHGFTFISGLKYALTLVVIIIMAAVWFYQSPNDIQNTESMLAAINTEDLVTYLDESDLSTDEVLESVQFNNNDLNDIEESVYKINLDNESLENFINEVD